MSPPAAAGDAASDTFGGCSVGAETKLWFVASLAGGGGAPAGSEWATRRAVVNDVPTRLVWPRLPTSAVTLTFSPSSKPRLRTKLAPFALAYERRRPLWLRLREPTTDTWEISPAGAPRKLICVFGDASGVPFSGDSVSASALVAATPVSA